MSVRWHRCCAWRYAAALVAVVTWLSCSAAYANPLQLLDGSSSLRSVAVRTQLARALAEEVSAALRRIGTPAPAESAEVIEEGAAIERLRDPHAVNARAQRLYASASFHQLRLTNTLAVVRDALECAALAHGPVRREMTCWAIAAAYFAERGVYDDALDVLMRSGRLRYGDGMTRTRWLAQPVLWARYSIAIQDHITIPFLRGDLD